MVKKYLPNGKAYFEAPFTPEEEDFFYERMSGAPRAILRRAPKSPPAGGKTPAAQPQPRRAKPPQP